MKSLVIAICVALLALFAGGEQGRAAASALTWRVGTARPTNGTWALIRNAEHQSQGLDSVWCDSATGFLIVYYDSAFTKIAGSAVMTDEWWSSEGIIAGASVGLSYSVIYFTRLTDDGPQALSCATIDPEGNVWIQVEGT